MSTVKEEYTFRPPLRRGVVTQVAAIVVLLAATAWGIWGAAHAVIGPVFLLSLIPAVISVWLVPLLSYRLYALRGAGYTLERRGIRLRWGLRSEDIPIETVSWVSLESELDTPIPLPLLRWPGAILGTRRMQDGRLIEYLASERSNLLLINTQQRLYAISPEDRGAFLQAFQRVAELGSITTMPPRSLHPTFLLARVWRSRVARYLLLAAIAFNLLLLGGVILAIPTHTTIILGFTSGTSPVPAIRLMLLPIISLFFFMASTLLGLFFFRREGRSAQNEVLIEEGSDVKLEPETPRPVNAKPLVPEAILSYLLWGTSALSSALFVLALFLILQVR